MMRKKSKGKIFLYTILIFYAFLTLFPFVWALSASFKSVAEIVGSGLKIIPEDPTLAAYKELFTESEYFIRWIFNSFFLATVITFINVILNTMAGYSLARIKFHGKQAVTHIIIATIAIPAQVLLIPNYIIITELGLNNTYTAVILLSAVNSAYIIMMRQFFINFPQEVEEAAVIDGLNRWKLLIKIVFPVAKPALATQALFIFMGVWNEFLKTKLYLSSPDKYTITVGLQALSQGEGETIPWDLVMAASIVSIIPMIFLYLALNQYFMTGIRIGSEK